jgi:hypothetical protein
MTGASSNGGAIIRRNTIASNQGGNGVDIGIKSRSADGTDLLTVINDNRIVSIGDGILNFSVCNVAGNIVSIAGGNPASELGQ